MCLSPVVHFQMETNPEAAKLSLSANEHATTTTTSTTTTATTTSFAIPIFVYNISPLNDKSTLHYSDLFV